MNTQLDKKLKNVIYLKWLPFIGDKYLKISDNNKLLIIGESHYLDPDDPKSIERHNSIDFTREVIDELAIRGNHYGTRIFPKFHKAMFANNEFDTETFWNLTSFYNFVQRPMEDKKVRPKDDDFYNGWLTFFETIKILKPKTCLFIGVKASNSLKRQIRGSDFELVSPIEYDKIIDGAYPRRATIKNADGPSIELIFIQHTSSPFFISWSKWNDYIKSKLSRQLDWFENEMKK